MDRVTYIKTHDILDSHNDTMKRLMPIKTQHRLGRKKVLKEITEQNYALQRRIDTARPTIDIKKMKKDHEHHKKVLSLMSRFKQNIPIQNRAKLTPMKKPIKSKSTKLLHNYDRSVNFSADEERNYYTDHPNRRLPPLENKRESMSEEEEQRIIEEAEENLMLEDYESNRVDVDIQVDEEEIETSLNNTDKSDNNNNQEEEEEEKEEEEEEEEVGKGVEVVEESYDETFDEDNNKDALDMISEDIPVEDRWIKKQEENNEEEEEVGGEESQVITIDDAILDDLQVAEEINPLEDSIIVHATELHEPADNLKPIPGISEEVDYILPSNNKYDDIEIEVIKSEYIDINTGDVLFVEDEEELNNKQIPGISEEIDLILPKHRYDERDINDLYMLEESAEFRIDNEGNEEEIKTEVEEVEKPKTPPTVPGISEIVELILPYKRYDEVKVVFTESETLDINENGIYEGSYQEFIVDFPPKQFILEHPVLSPSVFIDMKTGEEIFPE